MDRLGSLENFLLEGFRFDRCAGACSNSIKAVTKRRSRAQALDLLALLVRRRGELVSKDQIIVAVWPGRTVEEANLNVQISKLRRILDRNQPQGSCIQTVIGYGYRFIADVSNVQTKGMIEARRPPADASKDNTADSGGSYGPCGADDIYAMPLSRVCAFSRFVLCSPVTLASDREVKPRLCFSAHPTPSMTCTVDGLHACCRHPARSASSS
jgi:DNA-binding winged helix-turn-helix (wHTH) protein